MRFLLNLSPIFKKALTVIEIAMVVIIVAILAVVAIPQFEVFHDIKLQGAAKKLVSNIRLVQRIALSRHADCKLEFNEVSNGYKACYCNEADGTCAAGGCGDANWTAIKDPFTRGDLDVEYTSAAKSKYLGVDILNNFVDFGGTDTLRFDWEGIPRNENGVVLVNAGSLTLEYQNRRAIINVTPQTGKAKAILQ